jgi:tRNA A-37 threonylcarbamoyl transferase component Bud32
MDQVIKEFHGHSGSKVYLMKNSDDELYVRKVGNIERNYERLSALSNIVPVSKIYSKQSDSIDIEYIHGLDMKTYLLHNRVDELAEFINQVLETFSKNSVKKDYSSIYKNKLMTFNEYEFSFSKSDLLDAVPKILPQSLYHGDLTLENIINSGTKFYLIDAVTIEYDSYIFDIAKLRQDLHCKWFIRNDDLKLDVKLQHLERKICKYDIFTNDNSLLILMLFRVLNHCEKNDSNYCFIKNWIEQLWSKIKG